MVQLSKLLHVVVWRENIVFDGIQRLYCNNGHVPQLQVTGCRLLCIVRDFMWMHSAGVKEIDFEGNTTD
jgi:hypothetical protein